LRACNNIRAQIEAWSRSGPAAILRAPQLPTRNLQHDAFQPGPQGLSSGNCSKAGRGTLAAAPSLHGSRCCSTSRSHPRSELRILFLRRSSDTSLSGQISIAMSSALSHRARRVHHGKNMPLKLRLSSINGARVSRHPSAAFHPFQVAAPLDRCFPADSDQEIRSVPDTEWMWCEGSLQRSPFQDGSDFFVNSRSGLGSCRGSRRLSSKSMASSNAEAPLTVRLESVMTSWPPATIKGGRSASDHGAPSGLAMKQQLAGAAMGSRRGDADRCARAGVY